MSLIYRLLGRIASFRPGRFPAVVFLLMALASGGYALSAVLGLFSGDLEIVPCTVSQIVTAEAPPARYVAVSGRAMMHTPLERYGERISEFGGSGAYVLYYLFSLNDKEGHVLWVATRDNPIDREVGPATVTGELEYIDPDMHSFLIDKHLASYTGRFYVDERHQPRSPFNQLLVGLAVFVPCALLLAALWLLKRDSYTVFARDRGLRSPMGGEGLARITSASVTAVFEMGPAQAPVTLARSQIVPLESGGVEIRTTAVDTRKLDHTPSQGYWGLSLSPSSVQRLEVGRVYCTHPALPGLRVRYRTEAGDDRIAVIACDDERACRAIANQISSPNRDL